jgi:RNA polymerase sigma factor (sigma-70 family)
VAENTLETVIIHRDMMKSKRSTRQNRKNSNNDPFGDYLYMLVNKHIRKMAGKFYSILDADDINDIVHDAYLKVLDKKHLFKEDGNFEGWVFRICQNFVREITPKHSRKLVEIISYNADGADDSISNDCDYLSYMADETYMPDREICEREGQERFWEGISRLKGDNFKVANMMLEDYSSEEMEKELGCSNGNLRAKICRMRKVLKSFKVGA